jgi:predicted transcriptional regulator
LVRRRREKGEMVLDVLRAALRGDVKTRIMFRANLHTRSFNIIFRHLIESGLILKYWNGQGSFLYKTSDKGREVLKKGLEFYGKLPLKRERRVRASLQLQPC